jgi:hypothetical protein
VSTTNAALQHLQSASDSVTAAYAEIMHALPRLYGAHKNWAAEIATHLDEVIDHLDRLRIIVEGDLSAGQ